MMKKHVTFAAALLMLSCALSVPVLAEESTGSSAAVQETKEAESESEPETEAPDNPDKKKSKSGLVKKNGKSYIYKNKKMVKNKLGYKYKGSYYRISKSGAAKKVSTARGLAGIRLEKSGKSLKKAFKWSYSHIRFAAVKASRQKSNEKKAEYYATYGFTRGKGDCNVQAATFYMMAKVLGYDHVKYVEGKTLDKSGQRLVDHAWVTIKRKGKLYVYDPNLAYNYHFRTHASGVHSGYAMTYTKKPGATLKQYKYYTNGGTLLK